MSADLHTLLQEIAPRPQRPVDVDEVFGRVRRRRAGRRAAGVAAVLAMAVAAVGLAQLVGNQPSMPLIDEVEDAATLCRSDDIRRFVDGIDLDGDGLEDQARLDETEHLLKVCLGNGQTIDVREGTQRWTDWGGPLIGIEAVDLGGAPGIAVVEQTDRVDGRAVVFVRWVDGEFGTVDRYGWQETSQLYPHMEVSRIAYGCRPSTLINPETSRPVDFEVVQIVVHDAEGQNPATPEVEVAFFIESDLITGLSHTGFIDSRLTEGSTNRLDLTQFPDLDADSDLHQVLRDLGFTPRCIPED